MRIKNDQLAEQLSLLVKRGELSVPQKPVPKKPSYPQSKPLGSDKPADARLAANPAQLKRPSVAKPIAKRTPQRSTVPVYRGPLVRESRSEPSSLEPKHIPFKVAGLGDFATKGFQWAKSADADEYFLLDYSHGDLFQVAPNEQDSLTEVVLGVDFGTSSTKIIFRDTDRQTAYTVTFKTNTRQSAQFLPTALFKDNDSFSSFSSN